jgi:hypothetical protein
LDGIFLSSSVAAFSCNFNFGLRCSASDDCIGALRRPRGNVEQPPVWEADRFEAEAIEHENLANAHRVRTDALALKHTMSG